MYYKDVYKIDGEQFYVMIRAVENEIRLKI